MALALAVLAASSCGRTAASAPTGATWKPAPQLTAQPSSFKWANPTRVRGTLDGRSWTSTASFELPGGPATVVGVLKVPAAIAPHFSARLLPERCPAQFRGYAFVSAGLWHLPSIGAHEGALAGWFPYALPAGTYHLDVRRLDGPGTGGSYGLWVAGVR